MTKEYDEYKAAKGKHRAWNIALKVLEIVVILGCCLVGMVFLLMVAFPKGLWVGIFE